ncbi:MAG: protein kinase [Candidatus Omnitrophica bacterium]|nr:protein kinase [Candidatus Omnitrophota bacterium]
MKHKLTNLILLLLTISLLHTLAVCMGRAKGAAVPTAVGIMRVPLSSGQDNSLRPRAADERTIIDDVSDWKSIKRGDRVRLDGRICLILNDNIRHHPHVKIAKRLDTGQKVILKQAFDRREIVIMKGLNHPNIIKGFSAKDDSGNSVMISEYTKGPQLRLWVKRLHRDFPKKVVPKTLDIILPIIDAAEYLQYKAKVIDIDMTYENIIVRPGNDEPALFDFEDAERFRDLPAEELRRMETTNFLNVVEIAYFCLTKKDIEHRGRFCIPAGIDGGDESPILPPKTFNPMIPDELNAIMWDILSKQDITLADLKGFIANMKRYALKGRHTHIGAEKKGTRAVLQNKAGKKLQACI